ncbi:MAG: response regulator, partial [Pseudomonadota bacterium]
MLIVDDVEDNRALLGMALKRAGLADVKFAKDGEEGLAMTYQLRPDLVLLDVQMPTMDGLEMCRRLRADPATAGLPVIFQTALSSDDERVACFEAGGTDMVAKPINRREVVARIRNHLEKRILFRDLDAFRRRIAQELAQARSLQIGLTPSRRALDAVEKRLDVSIQATFEPSSEVGGDLWTLFDLDN